MKKIWQLLQGRNWKWMAAGGLCALALVIFWVTGAGSERNLSGETAVFEIEETSDITGTDDIMDAADEEKEQEQEVELCEEEKLLLSELYQAMTEENYDKAAAILNENEDEFRHLTEKTLEGKLYYYLEGMPEEETESAEMGLLLPESSFVGMVLTRYNTVFYGKFSCGKPNGEAAAIQTMILDQPRYSYAEGSWRDGKLNGDGTAGYYYYQDAPESGFVRVEKRGVFRENLLDSDFVYETESGNGERLSWNMKAVAGVTVITQDWEHYPYRKEYMLGSVEDSGRAYVLPESKVTEVLWNNLIVWPEQTALK